MQQAPLGSKSTRHDRRWLILAAIGIAQLMVVLDGRVLVGGRHPRRRLDRQRAAVRARPGAGVRGSGRRAGTGSRGLGHA
jgi:hypothetical protein